MSKLLMLLSQPALLTWLVKATVLLVGALAATALLRRASAGTRHLVWVGTLAGILLLPALSLWTPVRLAVLPMSLTHVALPTGNARQEAGAPTTTASRASTAHSPSDASIERTARRVIQAASSIPVPKERRPSMWTMMLVVWGSVSFVLLGWLAFGVLSVRRIVRSGRPLDDRAWTAPLCEIADRLDLDAVPRLLASERIEMPFACGVLDPTVVLPATAEGWNDSRRRAVLFHELAHVKRRDLLGHTLGRLASAFYWFHPLVWTAARRLRAESERACDDLVLSCGARASDYADHLLDIVISVRRYGAPATAMPMARRRELEGRVLAILDPAVQRIGPGRLQSLGLAGTLGVLALCIAAMTPRRESGGAMREAPRTARTDSVTRHSALDETAHSVAVKQLMPGLGSPAASVEREPRIAKSAPIATPAPAAAPSSVTAAAGTPIPSGEPSLSAAFGTITSVAVRAAASAIAGATSSLKSGSRSGPDSAKVGLLLKVLRSDQDPSVRRMAAWGLSEAGDAPEVVTALADALGNDESAEVREMAAWALSDSHRTIARRALADALRRDDSDDVRETSAWALGNSEAEDGRGALEAALTSDPSPDVRETAAWGLGYSPQRPAAHALVVALADKSSDVRETAAWALAEIEDEDTAPAIVAAFLKEPSSEVRTAELRALTFMHVDDKDVLDAALASKDADLRARAVRMLAGASAGAWPEPRPRPRPRPMP